MGIIFYSQKTERLIKKLEFTTEVKLLGQDVSITIQNEGHTGIKIIKKITNYMKRLIFSELYG